VTPLDSDHPHNWKKRHNYLTLVTDHDAKKVVWGEAGRDTKTLDAFFDDLGPDRSGQIEAVSMDWARPTPSPSAPTDTPRAR